MFLNTKASALMFSTLLISVIAGSQCFGQMGNRSSMLRQAQIRGQHVAHNQSAPPQPQNTSRVPNRVRVAQGSGTRIINSSPVTNSSPIVGGPSSNISGGYVPQHLQNQPIGSSVISNGPIVDGSSPVVDDNYIQDGGQGCGGDCGGGCGVGGNYFDQGFCGNRRGGCGPEAWDNCWIGCLGGIFNNSEIFAGAQGFRSRNFSAGNQQVDDSSFGFYGGINLGLSLCKLSCGLFSGQVGIRSSQSEFEGDFFSTDNRDQIFVTAGIFRRVDYGLQLGVVGDFFHEEWFVETDLAQIRGDIGWVYPGGNTLGMRFAIGTEDDVTNGIINGQAFNGLLSEVIDNYRVYYRMMASSGGHCDLFAGWSDADHAVLGLDYDMPINGCWGMQAGFTYFLPEDTAPTVPTSTQDAWNLYVGLSLRPQGPSWYGNYDRPLLNVADNGTFVFGRN